MHPQMSQQYMPNNFAIFTPSNIGTHGIPDSAQPIPFNNYDGSDYPHDPYAHFDMTKPIEPFQYLPSPQQTLQTQHYRPNDAAGPMLNGYSVPSYLSQNIYSPPHDSRPPQSSTPISNDESIQNQTIGRQASHLRLSKFDRTYTDAVEDELYDESSSATQSQNTMSGHVTPNFAFARQNQYANPMYRQTGTPTVSHAVPHQQPRLTANLQPSTTRIYPDSNSVYDPLNIRQDPSRLSSSAVADSMSRLQAPSRTTVSPREAFLDYPDNADFREKSLLSKSASPYSHHNDSGDASNNRDSESILSNDDDFDGTEAVENSIPTNQVSYLVPETRRRQYIPPTAVPISSRTTSQTGSTGLSNDVSGDSTNSSDSEYHPNATSIRRVSRGSARSVPLAKSFPCPECGKRFDKAQPLQTHRRTSHGKGNIPPSLADHKFSSSSSHRCDYVDPTTGKICGTVFSRP